MRVSTPTGSFAGGTCRRIVHDNQRFSEDLDFDNTGITKADVDALSQLIGQNDYHRLGKR